MCFDGRTNLAGLGEHSVEYFARSLDAVVRASTVSFSKINFCKNGKDQSGLRISGGILTAAHV